jgi:hypothetical protein
MARTWNEYNAQKIQLNSTENGSSGNTAYSASESITPPQRFMPRTLYFRDGQLTVGLMARISNEYLVQKVQINSTENGSSGNTANSASESIISYINILPQPKDLCPEHYILEMTNSL